MQPFTEQIVTLKNVFTPDLETKITSSVCSYIRAYYQSCSAAAKQHHARSYRKEKENHELIF